MKKETDMRSLRSVAHAFLMFEPQATDYSPMVIKHPFADSGIVPVRQEENNQMGVANIMEDENALAAWRKQIGKQIDEITSPQSLFLMLAKSYFLPFIKYAKPYLSQEDFSKFLSDAWIMYEAPNGDPNFTQKQLLGLFQSAAPEHLMTEEEYEAFQELEDTLTVYRGVTSYNGNRIKALSWTTDRETAEWFAHRFHEEGTVYEAEISKEHIYALFNGRNESEVIVDPRYLMNLSEVQDMDEGFSITQ